MFPTLETERLILREITIEDANAIFSSLSNDEVTRYYGQDTMKNIEEAEKIIDIFATNYVEKRGIRWGIQRKGDARNYMGQSVFMPGSININVLK